MPRLEVETIQDLKVLFEIGALTPDMSIKISRVLLGEEPGGAKRRKAAPAAGAQDAMFGQPDAQPDRQE